MCVILDKKSQIELFRIVDLIADAGLGTTAATSGPEPKPSLQCKKSPFVNHVVVAARRQQQRLGRRAWSLVQRAMMLRVFTANCLPFVFILQSNLCRTTYTEKAELATAHSLTPFLLVDLFMTIANKSRCFLLVVVTAVEDDFEL